jgi:hypothetical protein
LQFAKGRIGIPRGHCRVAALRPRRLALLRFRGFPAYCATPCHVALPVANDLSRPHREGRCAAQQNWQPHDRNGSIATRGAKGRSSHVRNAPLATVGAKKAACRNGPTTDVSSRNLMLAQRDGGLQSGAENAKLGRRSLGPLTLRPTLSEFGFEAMVSPIPSLFAENSRN